MALAPVEITSGNRKVLLSFGENMDLYDVFYEIVKGVVKNILVWHRLKDHITQMHVRSMEEDMSSVYFDIHFCCGHKSERTQIVLR